MQISHTQNTHLHTTSRQPCQTDPDAQTSSPLHRFSPEQLTFLSLLLSLLLIFDHLLCVLVLTVKAPLVTDTSTHSPLLQIQLPYHLQRHQQVLRLALPRDVPISITFLSLLYLNLSGFLMSVTTGD